MTNKNIISVHAPKAQKPRSIEQVGYFLAGLIDGDGHINKLGYIIIVFATNNGCLLFENNCRSWIRKNNKGKTSIYLHMLPLVGDY